MSYQPSNRACTSEAAIAPTFRRVTYVGAGTSSHDRCGIAIRLALRPLHEGDGLAGFYVGPEVSPTTERVVVLIDYEFWTSDQEAAHLDQVRGVALSDPHRRAGQVQAPVLQSSAALEPRRTLRARLDPIYRHEGVGTI